VLQIHRFLFQLDDFFFCGHGPILAASAILLLSSYLFLLPEYSPWCLFVSSVGIGMPFASNDTQDL